MNREILFNDGWEFAKSHLAVNDHTQLEFSPVDIPHDWLIYNTLDLYENSIGWYRKTFTISREDLDYQILLHFEGVYMDSSLFVNGKFIGTWKYGYSSFEHDITAALKEGTNEIVLKVVYQSPNSRWYTGAGIYRNVWLKIRGESYLETDGVYITTEKKDEGYAVEIETALVARQEFYLTHTIAYLDQQITTSTSKIKPGMTQNSQRLFVRHPHLWSTEKPHLYKVITTMSYSHPDERNINETDIIERISQRIGFRTVTFDPNKGFFLNDKHMKINGVCEHHDLGALGAAFNKVALQRRLQLLKGMGVNAIRTAHNMPAKDLMHLADEMGFLIVSEAFDMWERPKTTYDYARFFNEWVEKDVKSWVMRDRNHPSLIMWSIGNEVYDTHADVKRGKELIHMLIDLVRTYDPKANATITFGSNYLPWENTQQCAELVDVVGYNYAEKYYDEHHEKFPHWVIYGAETGSVVQSRGIYRFPVEQSILADDDEQCSSLGNSSTSWGAKSTEACIIADRDTPHSLGQFIWTGFDYLGEPTPYHTKNSYFGQLDTATFKKDAYYVYQAVWTDYRTQPMVHIFPYWDFNEGQLIDVSVCSNAPKIELQFNGKTLGTRKIDHQHGKELVARWKIPYQKGELKAIAYDESGKVIATDVKRSFGDAAEIMLIPDKKQLLANGTDLIFLEIATKDAAGNIVENANNRMHVEVIGAGRLIGLDNGDSTDYDQFKGKSKRLFSGKLMAIIGSTLDHGHVRVTVSSPGLPPKTIELAAVPVAPETIKGVSASMENKDLPILVGQVNEVPIRKIDLISDSGQTFHSDHPVKTVRAQLHPADATYQDVEWRIVTAGGIDSNLATVEANGLEAKVTALGDGNFRLRCTTKNGTEKIKIISELEFTATGLGKAYKDPYDFITGGLYDDSKGEVTNGNERGFATARDGETQVGFRDIDFGPYGSDIITIPIFTLSDAPYAIQIWEGMPDEEGSELLADVIYQKPSIWNVYQEETYRLSRRVKGITSICFVLQDKVHIKGFSFQRPNRTFAKNYAIESDHIYGDTYEMKESSVEGIGNNVSLAFKNFDFTEQGANKIVLHGRSPIDKNTIHLQFIDQTGETTRQVVEFTKTDGYEEKVFPLNQITGKQDVTFIFLPGSNFDFGWFRFE